MSDEPGMSRDEAVEYIPDGKIATELVNKFAEVTGTDTACAQFYLQDRNWNLQVRSTYSNIFSYNIIIML